MSGWVLAGGTDACWQGGQKLVIKTTLARVHVLLPREVEIVGAVALIGLAEHAESNSVISCRLIRIGRELN